MSSYPLYCLISCLDGKGLVLPINYTIYTIWLDKQSKN